MLRQEKEQPVALRVTSAFAYEGAIVTKGAVVEVPEDLAKDLLRRGKAELATEDDAKPAKPTEQPATPIAQPPADASPSELEKLTKAELLEMAKNLGVEVSASDSKAKLIATLEAKAK